MAYITVPDLDPFACIDDAKAEAMIDDAVAQAILVAPCLADEDDLDANQQAAVKAVLRGAILRWNDTGSGAFTQQQAGPFQVTHDTRQARRSLFWPSEIEQLEKICNAVTGGDGGVFAIDTAPGTNVIHDVACSLTFGATYCSCGASLAGFPLWGVE